MGFSVSLHDFLAEDWFHLENLCPAWRGGHHSHCIPLLVRITFATGRPAPLSCSPVAAAAPPLPPPPLPGRSPARGRGPPTGQRGIAVAGIMNLHTGAAGRGVPVPAGGGGGWRGEWSSQQPSVILL